MDDSHVIRDLIRLFFRKRNGIETTSFLKSTTLRSDEYLSQVRSFGALGYSLERIANLLGLSKKENFALLMRIFLARDTYF